MKRMISIIGLFALFAVEEAQACNPLLLHAPPYTVAELAGVCADDANLSTTGLPFNIFGFPAGTCRDAAGFGIAMQLCSSGTCTAVEQAKQCSGGGTGCAGFTVSCDTEPVIVNQYMTLFAQPNLTGTWPCSEPCVGQVGLGKISCCTCPVRHSMLWETYLMPIHKPVCDARFPPTQCCATGAGTPTCTGPGGIEGIGEIGDPTKCTAAPPPAFDPLAHRCGNAAGYQVSATPAQLATAGAADFSNLQNPMALCCLIGWAQAAKPATSNMDCIERRVNGGEDFLAFYNEGGPKGTPSVAIADPDKYADVLYPNRLFMVEPLTGVPVNGFYNAKGERCNYRTAGAVVLKTSVEQMTLFDSALVAGAPPADVLPSCCNLVVLGLERVCPAANPGSTAQDWVAQPPRSTVTRCTAAAEMKIHYALFDLCDPTAKQRPRFHNVVSIPALGESFTAMGKNYFPVTPVGLDALQKMNIPSPTPGGCLTGFKLVNGKCEID